MAQIILNDGTRVTRADQLQPRCGSVRRMVDAGSLERQLQQMRLEWTEAAGDLGGVTLNLNLLFDDIKELLR